MSDGTTPIIVFRDGSLTGSEILWTKLENIQEPDVAFNFEAVDEDTIPMNYTKTEEGYEHTPPVVEEVAVINIDGFKLALMADTNLSVDAKFNLGNLVPSIRENINHPDLLKTAWAYLKSTHQGWINAQVISIVETHASEFNIPLV